MTSLLTNVRPGDIISSQQFNDLITTINQLNSRVAALEAGGAGTGTGTGLNLTGFVPIVEQRVGEVVTISGNGFVTPIIDASGRPNNAVTFDGVPVPASDFILSLSNAVALGVRVPQALHSAAQPIPTNGRVVVLRVSNTSGYRELLYRVRPPVPSTTPTPVITSVLEPTLGTNELFIGGTGRISGTNLGSASAIVGIRVQTGTGFVDFPRAGDPSIAVLPGASQTQVDFTVPTYLTSVFGTATTRSATVLLSVGGVSTQQNTSIFISVP